MKVKVNSRLNKTEIMVTIVFCIGFVTGMIYAFCVGQRGIEREAEWLESILLYLRYGEVYYNDLFFYILKKRVGVFFILMLTCMTKYAGHILLAGVGITGLITGYIITRYIILKGIMGSVFFAVSVFPHYICYGYGYYKLLQKCRKKHVDPTCIDHCSRKRNSFEWKNLLPTVVVIIGLLMECYVNPFFVKIFLKIFM